MRLGDDGRTGDRADAAGPRAERGRRHDRGLLDERLDAAEPGEELLREGVVGMTREAAIEDVTHSDASPYACQRPDMSRARRDRVTRNAIGV